MPGAALLGQTITVIDRSGKVLKQSKTLLGVLKDAKNAYKDKKAEIVADRKAKAVDDDPKLRRLKGPDIQTRRPATVRVRSMDDEQIGGRDHGQSGRSRSKRPKTSSRKASHRDDSFFLTDPYSQNTNQQLVRSHVQLPQPGPPSLPPSYRSNPPSPRRSPPQPGPCAIPRKPSPQPDMNLAYGPFHAPSLQRSTTQTPSGELLEKCSALTTLLTEANCLQHSVTKTVANLQKNPDTLAAVGLTLAEISTMVGKLAPGALLSIKGLFPAVFALLAAPEFLIAVGVAAGVTIVVFGGYKIVKRIRARKGRAQSSEDLDADLDGLALEDYDGAEDEDEEDEEEELSSIDRWRRGISPDADAESADEEYVTPQAVKNIIDEAKQRRHNSDRADRKRREEKEKLDKKQDKEMKKQESSRERKAEKEKGKEKQVKKGKATGMMKAPLSNAKLLLLRT